MSLCLYRVLWTAGFCCVFSQYTCFPSTLTEASSRKSAQIPVMLQNPKKDPKENNFTFYTGLIRASEQFCSQITKQSQLELRDTVSLLELLKLYSYPCIVATRLSRCSYWRTNRYFFSLYLFESHRLKGMLCIIPLILFPSNHTVHKPLDSGWLVAFITQSGHSDLHNHCMVMVIICCNRGDNFVFSVVDWGDPISIPCPATDFWHSLDKLFTSFQYYSPVLCVDHQQVMIWYFN